jgi:hypothetical protein
VKPADTTVAHLQVDITAAQQQAAVVSMAAGAEASTAVAADGANQDRKCGSRCN